MRTESYTIINVIMEVLEQRDWQLFQRSNSVNIMGVADNAGLTCVQDIARQCEREKGLTFLIYIYMFLFSNH